MLRRVALFTLFVSIGFLVGMVITARMPSAQQSDAAAPPVDTAAQPVRAPIGGMPDLTAAAARAIASVPNISSTQIVRERSPFFNDPIYRFFNQDDFGYRDRQEQSLGSGVVVSADGYVLTNSHVVGNARAEVPVLMADKRELPARIVGVDEDTDIAVLKVDAANLPTLPWGDSSQLKVAEWVLAIGNPFGVLGQTVTLGIVSATGRTVGIADYEDFIQTDAAINRGNSGGALINARGELVGINTAIFSETGGYQGIGFAVPSNLVRRVMTDLIEHGQVRRATIPGIRISAVTTRYAEQLGAPNTQGALVLRVDTRADAYEAGIRPGDILVSFNGTPLEDAGQFMRMLSDATIGSTVSLGVFRDGKTVTIKVPVVQREPPRRVR
jgi:Do/DeqQ family serine protease